MAISKQLEASHSILSTLIIIVDGDKATCGHDMLIYLKLSSIEKQAYRLCHRNLHCTSDKIICTNIGNENNNKLPTCLYVCKAVNALWEVHRMCLTNFFIDCT